MNEQIKTLECIAEAISINYNLDEKESTEIVKNSFIVKLMESDYDFVIHYDAFYWADEIMSSRIMA